MSIEQLLQENTAALRELTAAVLKGGSATGTTTSAGTKGAKVDKAADKATTTKPNHTKAEMQAALTEVKEKFDAATAKAIIKAAGFDKMIDITENKFDEVYEAAKAKLEEAESDDDM